MPASFHLPALSFARNGPRTSFEPPGQMSCHWVPVKGFLCATVALSAPSMSSTPRLLSASSWSKKATALLLTDSMRSGGGVPDS